MRTLLLTALITLPALAQNPEILKNDWVRIVRAANTPNQLSRPHVHLINRIMIHLDPGTLRLDNKETGIARDVNFKKGEVRWDPRVGLHTSENIGGTKIRIIEIELSDTPPRVPATGLLKKLPKQFHLEMENAQVRILRTTLKPNQSAKTIFPSPLIAVRLTDGETIWRPANAPAITNDNTEASEWIFVELK